MCTSDLIFDVGMHLGEDTEFYLEKGFRVVGIEADPALCTAVADRLRDHVTRGRLTIVNAAIAEKPGRTAFYRDLDHSIWGTAEPDWVARNTGLGTRPERVERIEVDAVQMECMLAAHGVPYYMKIDIEGRDMLCVEALRHFRERPKYLSIEASKSALANVDAELGAMSALGYHDFKVVPQHAVVRQVPPNPSREGRYAQWRFAHGSSGLFGEEAPGDWLDVERTRQAYRPIFRAYRLVGDEPLIPVAAVRKLLRAFGFEAGWHDTHARLGRA
jgi:FkbM family methyltransferase